MRRAGEGRSPALLTRQNVVLISADLRLADRSRWEVVRASLANDAEQGLGTLQLWLQPIWKRNEEVEGDQGGQQVQEACRHVAKVHCDDEGKKDEREKVAGNIDEGEAEECRRGEKAAVSGLVVPSHSGYDDHAGARSGPQARC